MPEADSDSTTLSTAILDAQCAYYSLKGGIELLQLLADDGRELQSDAGSFLLAGLNREIGALHDHLQAVEQAAMAFRLSLLVPEDVERQVAQKMASACAPDLTGDDLETFVQAYIREGRAAPPQMTCGQLAGLALARVRQTSAPESAAGGGNDGPAMRGAVHDSIGVGA